MDNIVFFFCLVRVNYSKACYRLSLGSIIISFYHVLLAWKALHRTFCVDILMLIASKASLLILIIIETRVTSTHRQWFSVVCNSRQRYQISTVVKLLRTHSAAPHEFTTFFPLCWGISLLTRVQTTLSTVSIFTKVSTWKFSSHPY